MRVLRVMVGIAILAMSSGEFIALETIQDLLVKYGRKNLTSTEHDLLHYFFNTLHTPATRRSWSDFTHRIDVQCLVCNVVIGAVIVLAKTGSTDESLIEVATDFCKDFRFYSSEVCEGAISNNIPILTYVIKHRSDDRPDKLCSLFVQNSEDPNGCRLEDSQLDWTVVLPERPMEVPAVKQRKRKIPYTFAIITDPHLDPLYEPYSDTNCIDPVCCHAKLNATTRQGKTNTILDVTKITNSLTTVDGKMGLDLDKAKTYHDIPKNSFQTQNLDGPAGYWGNYKTCDSPIWSFDNVVDRIAEAHKNIDVVYFIGDSVNHAMWKTSYEGNKKLIKHVAEKLRRRFGDDVLIVPAIGNHEAHPINQFAPPSIKDEHLNTTWLYKYIADLYSHYLSEDAKLSISQSGSFSVLFKKRLRIISLNNNIAQRYNWWLALYPLQAKELLEWFVYELYKAEQNGEKVHILAHIPPGYTDLTYVWTREYNKIINRFSSTIMAEFNGHTHTDEFRIFYDPIDSSQAVAVAWGAAGATTYTNYNLNYKIITLNPTTFALNSIQTYIYNLSEANTHPQRPPRWFELYDFSDSYLLRDLTPASMNQLVNRMATREVNLVDLYAAYFTKFSDIDKCDTNCKADLLCGTVVTVLWERQMCNALKNSYLMNINK